MENNQLRIKPSERIKFVNEYYFSRKLKEIESLNNEGIEVINLGIGNPDMSPSESVIHRLIKESGYNFNHGYQNYNGIPKLRQAFAKWYKKYFSISLNPDSEILPLIGSKEGIMYITLAFVNPGDEVLVPDPGYPVYSSVTQLAGGIVRNYDLVEELNWHPDIDALEKQDLSKVRLMWINYPNMPTGAKASASLFSKLVSFACKHNILLCNDNPYSFILNYEHISILSVKGAKNTALEINSLSKSHNMAGWRVGMISGHADFISHILKVNSNIQSGMFRPIQLAATEALKAKNEWYINNNNIYAKRRILAEELMRLLGCTFNKDQSGLFLWGKIPPCFENGEILSDKLLNDARIFVTPGSVYGKNGNKYIRISICCNENILIKAINKIKKYKIWKQI